MYVCIWLNNAFASDFMIAKITKILGARNVSVIRCGACVYIKAYRVPRVIAITIIIWTKLVCALIPFLYRISMHEIYVYI